MTDKMTRDEGSKAPGRGKRKGAVRTAGGLDRIHARGDRDARRGLIILVGVLAAVLLVVVLALKAGGSEDKDSRAKAESKNSDVTEAPAAPPVPERWKLAILAATEGSIVWPSAPDKTRDEGCEVWDGEGLAADAASGGRLVLEEGGVVDFGPNTILEFAGGKVGDDQVLSLRSGFASFSFGKKGGKGRYEISGFGSFSAEPSLRIIVMTAPARADGHRVLYLHVRRGSGHFDLLGTDLLLGAGESRAFVVTGLGAESQLVTQVAHGKAVGTETRSLVATEGDRRIELDALHRLQPLLPETRLIARTLVDQERALADGGVNVDMFIYLEEKGLIPGDLRVLGGEAGDVDADVQLLRGDEVLAAGPFSSIIAKGLPDAEARFQRLVDAWLLPIEAADAKDDLLLFELKTEAIETFARVPVSLPAALDGKTVLVRPNLTGHAYLFLRALAVAFDHKIADSGDYGVSFVPASD